MLKHLPPDILLALFSYGGYFLFLLINFPPSIKKWLFIINKDIDSHY